MEMTRWGSHKIEANPELTQLVVAEAPLLQAELAHMAEYE